MVAETQSNVKSHVYPVRSKAPRASAAPPRQTVLELCFYSPSRVEGPHYKPKFYPSTSSGNKILAFSDGLGKPPAKIQKDDGPLLGRASHGLESRTDTCPVPIQSLIKVLRSCKPKAMPREKLRLAPLNSELVRGQFSAVAFGL